jgi:predicted dehydrogenase
VDLLRIAIIGAGRMGRIRAASAAAHSRCRVTHVVDLDPRRAQALAAEIATGCAWSTAWEPVVGLADVDAVVVSTAHQFLAPISCAALRAGKHVFCEKPMARTTREARQVLEAARNQAGGTEKPKMMVGFTLRQHPAIARAHRLVAEGEIGQPFYTRAHYGHGGRPGYDREWRMDPELGGGGELLDQGIHLIDLSRWFLGEFAEAAGMIGTYYWTGTAETDAPVTSGFARVPGSPAEDNAFLLLRTAIGQTASLHASWTQWKNAFQFEIYGREGSLAVTGLGGSYGRETLFETRRNRAGGVPEIIETTFETAGVWDREWQAFVGAVLPGSIAAGELSAPATLVDGWRALEIVQQVYDRAARPAPTRGTTSAGDFPLAGYHPEDIHPGVEQQLVLHGGGE